MNYRRLGKTGLQVSEISLGSWLTYNNSIEKDKSFSIIDTAFEVGINFFDCANVYGNGKAEEFLGEALNRYPREEFIITTKAFWPMNDKPNGKGLSRKHIFEQVHASLKRLQTDYIDIFYCHRFDHETDLYETLRTIDDLVRQGKILYVGVSEWSAAQIVEGLGIQDKYLMDKIVVNQPMYNLIDRRIEADILPISIKHNIATIPFSPLAQGFLSGKYRKSREIPKDSRAANETISQFIQKYLTPENFECIEKFITVAEQKVCTPTQLAISWLLHRPGVASVLMGASSPEQIEDNIQAINIKLSSEDIETLENIFS